MRRLINAIFRFFSLSKGEERVADYKSGHDNFRSM